MPRPISPKPFSNVSYLFPTLVHCPSCAALQLMHINEIRPARSIAEKIRFSISARSAAMKRQSGWQPREDRRKGVKSNGSP